jgi:hypothetical protein
MRLQMADRRYRSRPSSRSGGLQHKLKLKLIVEYGREHGSVEPCGVVDHNRVALLGGG